MATLTNITWTDHTWNPWEGCTKVSAGCDNCYMFAMLKMYGRDPTKVHRTKTWKQPYAWNRAALLDGTRHLVFTCSLSDWFHHDADPWRPEAWQVIRDCPHLNFQILTKRPDRIARHLPADWGSGFPNVWLGVSIERNDLQYLKRADVLRAVPARVRFISAEPLLGPLTDLDLTDIHWVVAGGESGHYYRPMELDWARGLRDHCQAAGVAFFYKQAAAPRPGKDPLLDGKEWKEFPE